MSIWMRCWERKIGKRVVLKISGSDVTVQPVASLAEQIYRNWVEENREYVAKKSGGRLGYVHMRDMSDAALTQFYMDLDSENRAKDGVVIDIRNNNGGFVNAYALDVLTRAALSDNDAAGRPAGAGTHDAGAKVAGVADDSGSESAFAFGCGGFHRGLPDAEAGQGGGRTDGRLDCVYGVDGTGGRVVDADAGNADSGGGWEEYGE